jgi:hypothetical protein
MPVAARQAQVLIILGDEIIEIDPKDITRLEIEQNTRTGQSEVHMSFLADIAFVANFLRDNYIISDGQVALLEE